MAAGPHSVSCQCLLPSCMGVPPWPAASGSQPWPAHAPCTAPPPSSGPSCAGGKRSTAGFKRRAGEVSLSLLAQTVLGKPLDKSQQVGAGFAVWLLCALLEGHEWHGLSIGARGACTAQLTGFRGFVSSVCCVSPSCPSCPPRPVHRLATGASARCRRSSCPTPPWTPSARCSSSEAWARSTTPFARGRACHTMCSPMTGGGAA